MWNFIKRIFRHRHKWKVARTGWPYKAGWGTHCPGCTILDTGLPSKEAAQKICDELNGK